MGFVRRDFLKGLAAGLLAPVSVIRPNLAPVPQDAPRPPAASQVGQRCVMELRASAAIRPGELVCYDHDTRYAFPAGRPGEGPAVPWDRGG